MEISILLTTYNRNDECIKCLESLKNQITNKTELILLDDWHIKSNKLEEYCSNNNFNYIHTGSQKGDKVKWRVPGFAYNIGAKLAKGEYYIIGGAEMYHLSNDCFKKMYNTNCASAPVVYDSNKKGEKESLLNNKLPFCFGLPSKIYHNIGGYDEDFTGYCFDDNDFSDRVLKLIPFKEVNAEIIHLWNPRGGSNRGDSRINKAAWLFNREIYLGRKNLIKRNKNREWGVL